MPNKTRAQSSFPTLKRRLKEVLAPDRVLTRRIDLIAYASDASFYRPVPVAVVLPETIDEVRSLFRVCREQAVPMTFRAAGTSLSGQAVTNGVLVEVKRHWSGMEVLDEGRKIRVRPGLIGAVANHALRLYGSKIGPDPASISSCTLGGILANNSSGKCCGVEQNAYHTLESLTFVLPSGTVVNTADADADEVFQTSEPELTAGLIAIKREIEENRQLAERIRVKYKTKNTTGYSLNAFLDFERPVDSFSHLLIGSEGTLAFIAEAVLNTVPDLPNKYTGLLFFETIYAACEAISPLRGAGAKALELMDRAALRAVEKQHGVPSLIASLPNNAAGLLVEFQAATQESLAAYQAAVHEIIRGLTLVAPAEFTADPAKIAALWRVREGMYPSVGAVRRSGTSVIIEDVAFPFEQLADAAVDLNALFKKHRYDEGIIFGHARDGNLHFVITQSFNDQASVEQYDSFIKDVVDLVVRKYDGALKAEHGTGRNMAPFVETEWGGHALSIMRRLKTLCDPENILNPGVILNSNPQAHLTDLKRLPSVELEVDRCVECGFCERVCPSRDLTLTPRQRIVVRREMALQELSGGCTRELDELRKDYVYMGIETCAADGMCATACPVGINTGALVKRLRHERGSRFGESLGRIAAARFSSIESLVRSSLFVGHAFQRLLGKRAMPAVTRFARSVVGPVVPLWSSEMPEPASSLPPTKRVGASAIYLPACIGRVFGSIPTRQAGHSLQEALVTVAARAGMPVWIPDELRGTCCGTPFLSKGYLGGFRIAANRAIDRCWEWTENGRIPVVIDASSCALGLRECGDVLTAANREKHRSLTVLDSVQFAREKLLPRLRVTRRVASVAVHPTCSVVEMGIESDLIDLATACSEHVVVPRNAGCCGFAGDRGFLFPELTAAATRAQAGDLRDLHCEDYVSSNLTCEIGMSRATHRVYRSIINLLEETTRTQ